MRLLTIYDFLKVPVGTLFQKYQRAAMDSEGLGIFHGACGGIDFMAEYPLDHHSAREHHASTVDRLAHADLDEPVPVAFGTHIIRDACHNPGQLFVVWDARDFDTFAAYVRQFPTSVDANPA